MQISLPNGNRDPLWSGLLAPAVQLNGVAMLAASIAMPERWDAPDLVAEPCQPLPGMGPAAVTRVFFLLRLGFTLDAHPDQAILDAEFTTTLKPEQDRIGMFADAYPRLQEGLLSPHIRLRVSPAFRMLTPDASAPPGCTEIDYGLVVPAVRCSGIGGARLSWSFQSQARFPLTGRRVLYAMVSLPADMATVTLALDLHVTMRGQNGANAHLVPPAEIRPRLSWRTPG